MLNDFRRNHGTSPAGLQNQRRSDRVQINRPIQIRIGSQITLLGELRDLSLRSAFIRMKNSTYMETNDEIGFAIPGDSASSENIIEGSARISRIEKGEGIAVYFTKLQDGSSGRIQELVGAR
jgi:hypothetical protein